MMTGLGGFVLAIVCQNLVSELLGFLVCDARVL